MPQIMKKPEFNNNFQSEAAYRNESETISVIFTPNIPKIS
jgi:hypothetical protein